MQRRRTVPVAIALDLDIPCTSSGLNGIVDEWEELVSRGSFHRLEGCYVFLQFKFFIWGIHKGRFDYCRSFQATLDISAIGTLTIFRADNSSLKALTVLLEAARLATSAATSMFDFRFLIVYLWTKGGWVSLKSHLDCFLPIPLEGAIVIAANAIAIKTILPRRKTLSI
jgi:hypothetical protein